MTANYERGLNLVKGDYVCFIGDDDAMMPEVLLQLAGVIVSNSFPEAFIFPHADYGWPGVASMIPDKSYIENAVYHQPVDQISPGFVAPSIVFNEFLAAKRTYRNLPGVYHNCVKRSALQRIFANGLWLCSTSPDIYSAVALTATVKSIYLANFFLCLVGTSAASVGLAVHTADRSNDLAASVLQACIEESPFPLHRFFGPKGVGGSLRLIEYECYLQVRDQGLLAKSDLICAVSFAKAAIAEALSPFQPNGVEILDALSHLAGNLDIKSIEQIMPMLASARQKLLSMPPSQVSESKCDIALLQGDLELNPIPASCYGVNDVLGASSLLALASCLRKNSARKESYYLEQIDNILTSSSWRLTSPLRLLMATLKSLWR
jgi:hypothetical protein